MNRKILQKTIQETLQRYILEGQVKTAYEIGNGLCEEFAEDVNRILGDPKDLHVIEYANYTGELGCEVCDEVFYQKTLTKFGVPKPKGVTIAQLNACGIGRIGTHVFLRFKNCWFDAEAPQGVPSPFLLPFAQRYLQKKRFPQKKNQTKVGPTASKYPMKKLLPIILAGILGISSVSAQTTWEYQTIKFGNSTLSETYAGDYAKILQTEGKKGWELVTIFAPEVDLYGKPRYWEAIFKKPVKP